MHLATCERCRTRRAELARLSEALRATCQNEVLPSIGASRAQLKSRLDELVCAAQGETAGRWLDRWAVLRRVAYGPAVMLMVALAGLLIGIRHHRVSRDTSAEAAGIPPTALPQPNLTPGAIRRVSLADVCRMPEETVGAVPVALQREVLREYRLQDVRLADYELDYLITPDLGGAADDVRNLWPEPHYSVEWNSYVKDDLENYLHQQVCARKIALPVAQHALATDWIAAYKKYFHTNTPLAEGQLRRLRIAARRERRG